jgi:hypothetical protein
VSRAALIAIGACTALMLAACGERPQVITYKQGSYQGKPDQKPYAGAPFDGNQQAWDNAMRTRNQSQNEYKRIGG